MSPNPQTNGLTNGNSQGAQERKISSRDTLGAEGVAEKRLEDTVGTTICYPTRTRSQRNLPIHIRQQYANYKNTVFKIVIQ